MNAYQLSLFGEAPTPINNQKSRKSAPRQQTHTIQCTTEQAAILMEISKSTLYSARKQGMTYQNKGLNKSKNLGIISQTFLRFCNTFSHLRAINFQNIGNISEILAMLIRQGIY